MSTHEEDEMEDLRSTVYTFPTSVQSVIEQVRIYVNLTFDVYLLILISTYSILYVVNEKELLFNSFHLLKIY